jgi:hypothetical protein
MLDYYRFKKVNDLFMQGKVEEARLELAGLQRRYVALCSENTSFKMQMQEYEDILYLARNLVLEDGFYWLITGNIKQGPFCPKCYDNEGMLMRLAGDPGDRFCTACRESFVSRPRREERRAVASLDHAPVCDDCAPLREAAPRKAKIIPFGQSPCAAAGPRP